MCPLAFAGGPTVTLDSAHNCSSPQTLLLRGFFLWGGVLLFGSGSLPSCGFSRSKGGGRVSSSLAERSFMVTRDTPVDGLIPRIVQNVEGSLLPPR